MHANSRASTHRSGSALNEGLQLLALCVLLGLVVRWPLGLQPGLLPTDPNAPLHALLANQLAQGGPMDTLLSFGWPDGLPVRVVGLPLLLLAVPWVGLLGSMGALQLATTVGLILQGMIVGWVARQLGIEQRGALAASAAAILAPMSIHVQGIGQVENLALGFLALCAYGGLKGGRLGWGCAAMGLLLAVFSSPYQAFSAGVLLLVTAAFRSRQALAKATAMAITIAAIAVPYYLGAARGSAAEGGASSSPPEQGHWASAGISDMLWPRSVWFTDTLEMPGIGSRLAQIGTAPKPASLVDFPWSTPHQVSYLGWVLLGVGLFGLWTVRNKPLGRALSLAAATCTLCAMGPEARLFGEKLGGFPMPWALIADIPGLGQLAATHRFLSGAVLALVLGLGIAVSRLGQVGLVAVIAALATDGLLIAPVHWPLPTSTIIGPPIANELPDSPIALWPPLGTRPPQDHELVALILNRNVAVYQGPLDSNAVGHWLSTATEAGAKGLLKLPSGSSSLPDTLGRNRDGFMLGEERCPTDLCWRTLQAAP